MSQVAAVAPRSIAVAPASSSGSYRGAQRNDASGVLGGQIHGPQAFLGFQHFDAFRGAHKQISN